MSAPEEPRGLRERVAEIEKLCYRAVMRSAELGVTSDPDADMERVDQEFRAAVLALLVGDEEPVAYAPIALEGRDGLLYEFPLSRLVAFREEAQAKHEWPEYPVIPLYTRPAPTQEVERLREALERIASMGEYGCYSHTGGEWAHSDDCTVGIARRALNEGRQADTDTTEGE